MRIHTTLDNLHAAIGPAREFGGRPLPVTWHKLDRTGSSIRPYAFTVLLEGSGGRNNTGLYGAGDYCGATWDEWGAFLGRVFQLDPTAVVGSPGAPVYGGADHFRWATGGRFESGQIPADTHPRHRWNRGGAYWEDRDRGYFESTCDRKAGCTAVRRRPLWGETFAEDIRGGVYA